LIHDVQYRPANWTVDYSPYKDIEITLTGVITTPLEFNEQYRAFAIQEKQDYWSGVFVRGFVPDLEAGSLVRVTGIVRERDTGDPNKWRYMTYIEIEDEGDIEVLGNDDIPAPMEVEVADLVFSTHAEDLEGVLIHLSDFEIGDMNSVNPALAGIYYPITDADPDDPHDGWMCTYGLDLESPEVEDLELGNFRQAHTSSL